MKHNYDDYDDYDEEWELDEDEVDLSAKTIEHPEPAKTMSVITMGRMLGLRKTDSYWLAHKNAFKVFTVSGRMRVDIESFENWYANQIKYHKIDGTPPGEKLQSRTYGITEISEMLGICEAYTYEVLEKNGIQPIIVDYWKRWPKKAIDKWYKSQSRYRNKDDRESDLPDIERTMSMTEMAFLLGIKRNTVYSLLDNPKHKKFFEIIIVADRKRITKDSFEKWYSNQKKYKMQYDSIEEAQAAKANAKPIIAPPKVEPDITPSIDNRHLSLSGKSSNPNYYSVEEIAEILEVKKSTVGKMIRGNIIPYIAVAGSYRIPKLDFDRWLIEQEESLESEDN